MINRRMVKDSKVDEFGREWHLKNTFGVWPNVFWPNGNPCQLVYETIASMNQLVERYNEDGVLIGSKII